MRFFLPCSTTVPNFKTIRGGPWKNIQKFVELTWNDPKLDQFGQVLKSAMLVYLSVELPIWGITLQKLHVDIIIMYVFCLNENQCKKKLEKIKITIIKNIFVIPIAGKVSRYIDASMNRTTPSRRWVLRNTGPGVYRLDSITKAKRYKVKGFGGHQDFRKKLHLNGPLRVMRHLK